MIAKLIVHGRDRGEALARMRAALDGFHIGGVVSNIPLQATLMDEPGFVEGGMNIHHLEHWLAERSSQ